MTPRIMAVIVLILYVLFYHFYARRFLARKVFNLVVKQEPMLVPKVAHPVLAPKLAPLVKAVL